jgi:hypothetical protein
LERLGLFVKLGRWIPAQLTDERRFLRITTCEALLAKIPRSEFLDSIITGDETWIPWASPRRMSQIVGRLEETEPEPKEVMSKKSKFLQFFGITKESSGGNWPNPAHT